MNRSTWLISVLAVLAVIAAIAPRPAEAGCGNPWQFGSAYAPGPIPATYVYAPGPASLNSSGQFRLGRFWEPGKRSGAAGAGQDEGNCSASGTCGGSFPAWFTRFGTFPWYINGQIDSALVDGCPGIPAAQDPAGDGSGPDELIVAIFDRDATPGAAGGEAYYYAARTVFRLADAPEFNMKQQTACNWQNFNMQPIPRPNVTMSSRGGPTGVLLTFTIADIALGAQVRDSACAPASPYSTITGYNICTFSGPSEPGRLASAWTCVAGPATGPGGAVVTAFPAQCPAPPFQDDQFVAIQLRFDGGPAAGGYDSEYVSRSVRIECDPNLAEPGETRQPERRPRRPQPDGGKGSRPR